MDENTRYMTTREVAAYVGLSPRTLESYRSRGGGPPFYVVGSVLVRYLLSEVADWVSARRRHSTSDDGQRARARKTGTRRMTRKKRMRALTALGGHGDDGRCRSAAGRSIASAIGPAIGFPAPRPGHLRGECARARTTVRPESKVKGGLALNAEDTEAGPEVGQVPAAPDIDPASALWGENRPHRASALRRSHRRLRRTVRRPGRPRFRCGRQEHVLPTAARHGSGLGDRCRGPVRPAQGTGRLPSRRRGKAAPAEAEAST